MKDIKELKEMIDKELTTIKTHLMEQGVVEKAQDFILRGEEVRMCLYCHTFNAFSVYFNKKQKWETFQCEKCGKVFLVNWRQNG